MGNPKRQDTVKAKLFIIKGEKGISAIQIDLESKQITKSNLAAIDECNNVFSECLQVERQLPNTAGKAGLVRVLATSNVEVEDNMFKRKIVKIDIPIVY